MVTATDFVRESLEELDGFFGVREAVLADPLVRHHAAGDNEALSKAIAQHIGLPIQVRLSVASPNSRFDSRQLARTDHTGRGIEGIEAQVAVPSDLPLFGSPQLRGYPVGVLVTAGFASAGAETAITLLAHEFAHVLLHSLRHPKRESEVFTDLVPLVLGFAEMVHRGRTVSSVTDEGDVMRTTTTTYGYLSDVDFSFALNRVRLLLHERKQRRMRLLENTVALRCKVARNSALLTRFADWKRHLDAAPGKVRQRDAARIVAAHAPDFTRGFEVSIHAALDVAARAEGFGKSVVHYSKDGLGELGQHEERCAIAASQLDEAFAQLKTDAAILARNCDVRYRLRELFRSMVR